MERQYKQRELLSTVRRICRLASHFVQVRSFHSCARCSIIRISPCISTHFTFGKSTVCENNKSHRRRIGELSRRSVIAWCLFNLVKKVNFNLYSRDFLTDKTAWKNFGRAGTSKYDHKIRLFRKNKLYSKQHFTTARFSLGIYENANCTSIYCACSAAIN